MTPKLLLALALVGAMHGEPVPPAAIYPVITIPPDFPNLASTITLPAEFSGKIVVRREPTVTRKADGSWEITFAGKKTEPAADFFSSVVGGTPMTPEMIAASEIMPPAPPTVLWPNDKIDADRAAWIAAESAKAENKNSIVIHDFYSGENPFVFHNNDKAYEFGLRSDGCVVWRERK